MTESEETLLHAAGILRLAEACGRATWGENLSAFLLLHAVTEAAIFPDERHQEQLSVVVFSGDRLDSKLATLVPSAWLVLWLDGWQVSDSVHVPQDEARKLWLDRRRAYFSGAGRGSLAKIKQTLRILRDYVKENANSLIQEAAVRIMPRFAYVLSKYRTLNDGRVMSDYDRTVASEYKAIHTKLNSLILDWSHSRKRGEKPPPQVGPVAEGLLRKAFSLRVLQAALECRLHHGYHRTELIEGVLEAVLVALGPERATSICGDLFERIGESPE
jgi:hypothetical protein